MPVRCRCDATRAIPFLVRSGGALRIPDWLAAIPDPLLVLDMHGLLDGMQEGYKMGDIRVSEKIGIRTREYSLCCIRCAWPSGLGSVCPVRWS